MQEQVRLASSDWDQALKEADGANASQSSGDDSGSENLGMRLTAEEAAAAFQRIHGSAKKVVAMKTKHIKLLKDPESVKTRERLGLQAWRELQTVKDRDLRAADATSVTDLLDGWSYFARFWDKGVDGPKNPLTLEASNRNDVAYVVSVTSEQPTPTVSASATPLAPELEPQQPMMHNSAKNKGRFARRTVGSGDGMEAEKPREDILGQSLDM